MTHITGQSVASQWTQSHKSKVMLISRMKARDWNWKKFPSLPWHSRDMCHGSWSHWKFTLFFRPLAAWPHTGLAVATSSRSSLLTKYNTTSTTSTTDFTWVMIEERLVNSSNNRLQAASSSICTFAILQAAHSKTMSFDRSRLVSCLLVPVGDFGRIWWNIRNNKRLEKVIIILFWKIRNRDPP